jgi:hypothetical protein
MKNPLVPQGSRNLSGVRPGRARPPWNRVPLPGYKESHMRRLLKWLAPHFSGIRSPNGLYRLVREAMG